MDLVSAWRNRDPRESASKRGYGSSPGSAWQRFRRRFVAQLLERGIPPYCGAHLPDGPSTQDSQCQADGIKNPDANIFDHAPPLTEAERAAAVAGDRSAFDDPLRIQLLCARCHNAKSRREQDMR